MSANFTAKIVAARRVRGSVEGMIFSDVHDRWPAGTRIRTSRIVHEDGNIVSTENSIYDVTWETDREGR